MHVVVVDTLHANMRSVQKSVELAASELSGSATVERSRDPDRIRACDKVIVPGQGGFGGCVNAITGDIEEAIRERIHVGTPYFGICLGLQILFESSEESPGVPGFGLFKGSVQKIEERPGLKIPHMGWNQIESNAGSHPVLERGGGAGTWFYFVHSFHAVPDDPNVVKAYAEYGPLRLTAAVAKDNVLATQFHPEKSQRAGIDLLRAFLAL